MGNTYEYVLRNRRFSDLNPLMIGEERCSPDHAFGPAARKYVLIHYVTEGQGIFINAEGSHTVRAGEAFLIRPGEITLYRADHDHPWFYRWVAFDGGISERFSELPPVLSFRSDPILPMLEVDRNGGMAEYRIASLLFSMYAELFDGREERRDYVARVKDYIRTLYMQDIRVEEIAARVNLDRRYLSRLFRSKTGMTVQEYLIHVRMEEAKRLLESGASVADASSLCGYDDVCNFSKMFKKKFGVSPGKWK